ncbi:MAG: hypothetical protein H6721_12650 [Sandaracinus sp.]|nr:hypothetical protein [Sandaracinus sp.]MCB9622649.1 hypothetical protein [Sandaracinus sp.]MCB9632969.1 hypothetical protein [Sandaracinus sp.]
MRRLGLLTLAMAAAPFFARPAAASGQSAPQALSGVRLSLAADLAITGSGVVEEDGLGWSGRSGPALGVEARGGWVHESGAGVGLRVGFAGLSVLARGRDLLTPPGEPREDAVLVEAGPVFSYGRATRIRRTFLEARGEAGFAYGRILQAETRGLSLLFGAEGSVFVHPRFALTLAVDYRWFGLRKPDDDAVRGTEVFVRLGPTLRFP